jgi:hypothetical protein
MFLKECMRFPNIFISVQCLVPFSMSRGGLMVGRTHQLEDVAAAAASRLMVILDLHLGGLASFGSTVISPLLALISTLRVFGALGGIDAG